MTTEILRLLVTDPHHRKLYEAQGLSQEEGAACQFSLLEESGVAILVAESDNRLTGLLSLVPDIQTSAWLDRQVWSVRHLVVAPEAPSQTVSTLVGAALAPFADQIECLTARVPATDGTAIQGLKNSGFQITGCEVASVLSCDQPEPWQPPSVDFAPFGPGHVHAAAALLLNSRRTETSLPDSDTQPSRLAGYYEYQLMVQAREPHAGGVVAQSSSGQLLGFVTFTRDGWLQEYTQRRLASLDYCCLHPRVLHNGLGELLFRQTLAELARNSVEAATIETCMNGTNPDFILQIIRKLGGKLGMSTMIMRRWLNDATQKTMEGA